jgi:hypothetical protein
MQHAGARESENDCGNESRGGEGCPFIDPRRGEVMGGGIRPGVGLMRKGEGQCSGTTTRAHEEDS